MKDKDLVHGHTSPAGDCDRRFFLVSKAPPRIPGSPYTGLMNSINALLCLTVRGESSLRAVLGSTSVGASLSLAHFLNFS